MDAGFVHPANQFIFAFEQSHVPGLLEQKHFRKECERLKNDLTPSDQIKTNIMWSTHIFTCFIGFLYLVFETQNHIIYHLLLILIFCLVWAPFGWIFEGFLIEIIAKYFLGIPFRSYISDLEDPHEQITQEHVVLFQRNEYQLWVSSLFQQAKEFALNNALLLVLPDIRNTPKTVTLTFHTTTDFFSQKMKRRFRYQPLD